MVTKELIIETATKLFIDNGVKSITVERIVTDLHTSKRTFYNHFSDKTELLKACLGVYHRKICLENQTIIDNSKNAIEAMGLLHQKIVQRASAVNPNFFNDILRYYPRVLPESYSDTRNFAHRQLVDLGKWGIEEGIFIEEIDIDVVVKTVLSLLKLLKDNDLFPVTKYSKERLTFGVMLPYMKGLCTSKGLKILKKQEELFRVSI